MFRIGDLLKGNQDAMVIVGAGHLVGPQGVIALLEHEGWVVTQE